MYICTVQHSQASGSGSIYLSIYLPYLQYIHLVSSIQSQVYKSPGGWSRPSSFLSLSLSFFRTGPDPSLFAGISEWGCCVVSIEGGQRKSPELWGGVPRYMYTCTCTVHFSTYYIIRPCAERPPSFTLFLDSRFFLCIIALCFPPSFHIGTSLVLMLNMPACLLACFVRCLRQVISYHVR